MLHDADPIPSFEQQPLESRQRFYGTSHMGRALTCSLLSFT